jgi:CBS domain-containing protein
MLYLSQVLQRDLLQGDEKFGKVVDLVVSSDTQSPQIEKLLVKQHKKRITIAADSVAFVDNHWQLKKREVEPLPRNDKDFFLAEDLLDKQVIDINGKRLVRVNDIIIRENGSLKVEGIDIGFSGIMRRLGFGLNALQWRTITLPWSLIEAFDYQTGNIQLKLTQSKLNAFHPAEIADILEEAGAKERVGLVKALDAKKAAYAISKADTETQSAILEQVPTTNLKSILAKMRNSAIADVVDHVNPFTSNEILKTLEPEQAKKVKRLLIFEDDEAGGLMDFTFYKNHGDKTVGETMSFLAENDIQPEMIIVVDDEGKLQGAIHIKNLINVNSEIQLKALIKQRRFVYEDAPFSQIFRMFAEYNLRVLPVVDKNKVVIGIIPVESILHRIQEEEEKEDAF